MKIEAIKKMIDANQAATVQEQQAVVAEEPKVEEVVVVSEPVKVEEPAVSTPTFKKKKSSV